MLPKEDTQNRETNQSTTHQDKENKGRPNKNGPAAKVVIRHLPPSMTKDCFLEEVSPLPKNDYLCFVNADLTLGRFAFSRAYINFCNQEDIFIFTEKFDGYVFVDSKGDEYPAIVEFAPFQKIPRKSNRKKDNKCGTIETDPDFLKFLENKEKQSETETTMSAVETLEEINAKERELKANKGVIKVSTPLLDFLRKKKEDRIRIRDEKREERDRKRAEKRKQRDDDKKKVKDVKRQGDKIKQEKAPQKILTAKPKEEVKVVEEELTKNLKDMLKIGAGKDGPEESKSGVAPTENQPERKKAPPAREGKPEHPRKRDPPKRDKKSQGPVDEKKEGKRETEKSDTKVKQNTPSKETKSYKEERQKMKEARAARAAAKQESNQPKEADGDAKAESEDSSSSSKTQQYSEGGGKPGRLRNKDRPALQIYRPGMLKRGDGKGGSDGPSSELSGAKQSEDGQKPSKSRTFVSRRRKPASSEQAENSG
ncbi:regulator of nonsense transcripts 3B [Neocloeon triangulifer]|uniref:regulator of nonsense transcripts 3B n=1 Tax=Neocloeon triangulifer TaxID=2078957 RepID=UPI00286F686B|nr:regulator of nonsense transcripts 3B [Neocloeon triangulifer]